LNLNKTNSKFDILNIGLLKWLRSRDRHAHLKIPETVNTVCHRGAEDNTYSKPSSSLFSTVLPIEVRTHVLSQNVSTSTHGRFLREQSCLSTSHDLIRDQVISEQLCYKLMWNVARDTRYPDIAHGIAESLLWSKNVLYSARPSLCFFISPRRTRPGADI